MSTEPENPPQDPPSAGGKTRAKLRLLDAVTAAAVLMLVLEFWVFSTSPLGAVSLWLMIVIILAAQILKMRLRCPACGGSAYRSWHYSYQSKVPTKCDHCGAPIP